MIKFPMMNEAGFKPSGGSADAPSGQSAAPDLAQNADASAKVLVHNSNAAAKDLVHNVSASAKNLAQNPNAAAKDSRAIEAAMTDMKDTVDPKDVKIARLAGELAAAREETEQLRAKGKLMSRELDLFRQRRLIYWSDRFRSQFNAWNLMNPGFQQLKDDSSIANGSLNGFRLQPSLSLLRIPFLTYRFRLPKDNLSGILLAPVLEVPLLTGEIGIKLLSSQYATLAEATAPISDVHDDRPTEFRFAGVGKAGDELEMQVYVQGVDIPVRVFELRRYALGGFGRLTTKPFLGLLYGD